MKTILIIIAALAVLFILFVLAGIYLRHIRLKRLKEERDNLNLTTLPGKNRAKVLNKQIDRIYGYK